MIIKSFLKKKQLYQEEEQTPHIWCLESPWVELNKIKKLQVIPS